MCKKTDVNENTIFSSIKIFLCEQSKITFPIYFTIFTYDDLGDYMEKIIIDRIVNTL